MSESTGPPLLRMERIDKSFPGVVALRGVDLELHRGEVLALLGENGAGKSTLTNILGGAIRPDAGDIRINDEPANIRSPFDARRRGIAVIHQEFSLVPTLSVVDNIFLGREKTRAGILQRGDESARCRELFQRLGVEVEPWRLCRSLSVAQQQAVEIAKALALDARVVVMDEPTAPLTPREVERLFAIVRELRAHGLGIVYITHRLEEIFAIADRVMVLRDGRHVATRRIHDLSRDQLIEMMVGRPLDQEFPKRSVTLGPKRLDVRGLRRGDKVRDVSLGVRAGEIVALTGLVGAGRTETARLIVGIDRRDAGEILLDGEIIRVSSPRDALRAGLCLLPEDRKHQGLILPHSTLHNFGLPNLRRHSRSGFINGRSERERFRHYATSLNIKVAHPDMPARNLSGGNQQKVVLAKWLERNCRVLIFDEPTRGVDVGAKVEIYQLMNALAAEGKAILMISSDLLEALGMADRILVMRAGRIAGEITDVTAATQDQIMRFAVG